MIHINVSSPGRPQATTGIMQLKESFENMLDADGHAKSR